MIRWLVPAAALGFIAWATSATADALVEFTRMLAQ